MKIISNFNLFFHSKIEKQAYSALIWLKDETEDDHYHITQKILTKVIAERIKDIDANKPGGIFASTKNYPLKGHIHLVDYLTTKGLLNQRGNDWVISNTGLEKISELGDVNATIYKIISMLGTIGGLAYLTKLVNFF